MLVTSGGPSLDSFVLVVRCRLSRGVALALLPPRSRPIPSHPPAGLQPQLQGQGQGLGVGQGWGQVQVPLPLAAKCWELRWGPSLAASLEPREVCLCVRAAGFFFFLRRVFCMAANHTSLVVHSLKCVCVGGGGLYNIDTNASPLWRLVCAHPHVHEQRPRKS